MKKETKTCDREPELKNEFINKIRDIESQESIEVDDFGKRYNFKI